MSINATEISAPTGPTPLDVGRELDFMRLQVEDGPEVEQWYDAVLWLDAGDPGAAHALLRGLRRTVVRRRARRLQRLRIKHNPRESLLARLSKRVGLPFRQAGHRLRLRGRRLRLTVMAPAHSPASPYTHHG